MPFTIHETFVDLSDADFTSYATGLIDAYPSSQKRKEAISEVVVWGHGNVNWNP